MSETKYKSWSDEEVELLLKLKKTGMSYNEISKHFKNRTSVQLKSKYGSIKRKIKEENITKIDSNKVTRVPWTKEEDEILLENAHEEWANLAVLLPKRTIKSMKHRLAKLKISRMKVVLSDEDKQYIINNYLSMSITDISKNLNIKRSTIYGFLNTNGYQVSDFVWEAQDIELLEGSYKVKVKFKKVVDNDASN